MKKLICLLLSVLLLVGASAAMADSVKLKIATWTSNETQLALLGSFVDEFAQKKGIDIDYTFESLSGAEYSSLLLMDLQSNEAPDAFWIMESDIKAFIGAGLCAKLNDALTDYDPDDIDAGALSLWRDGDDIYAVPFSTSPFIMIYNKDLFEQAGLKDPNEYVAEGTWTWETFRECMKTIKEKTGVYGYMTVNNAGFADRTEMNLTPFVRGFGGDFWTDDLEVKIDSAESIAGVQFFHDMVFEDESVVPAGDQSNFFTGGAACTFNQISQLGNLKDVTWQWGICKLPATFPSSVRPPCPPTRAARMPSWPPSWSPT
ncbi:MAG: ABC transporter substrate-binding protein [Christensenellales bacterium]